MVSTFTQNEEVDDVRKKNKAFFEIQNQGRSVFVQKKMGGGGGQVVIHENDSMHGVKHSKEQLCTLQTCIGIWIWGCLEDCGALVQQSEAVDRIWDHLYWSLHCPPKPWQIPLKGGEGRQKAC